MNEWAPIFSLRMGIPPQRLGDLSVPQMVDHVIYMIELDKG